MFVGQRIEWKTHDKYGSYISVGQKLAVDAVEEVKIDKSLKDNVQCNPQLHTAYRSVLGQLSWLQSRTQVHLCYKFSRCALAAANRLSEMSGKSIKLYAPSRVSTLMHDFDLLRVHDVFLACPMHLIATTVINLVSVHQSFS
jgi:hypothetical protein